LKNHKIANYSTSTEAGERKGVSTDLESLQF